MAVREIDTQPQADSSPDAAPEGMAHEAWGQDDVSHSNAPGDGVNGSARQTPLASQAVEFLQIAASQEPDESGSSVEERSIWQPDSWLMQRTWQALADEGAGEEAFTVAALQEMRNPLATVEALYRLALRARAEPALRPMVAHELQAMRVKLFGSWVVSDETRQTERLLLAAASAVCIEDESLALSCLERIDQIDRGWDRVVLRAESRTLLAETIRGVGLHPLTSYLISTSIRRHEEAGAEFLHQIVSRIDRQDHNADMSRRSSRLLRKCVETFQYATLSSLNSRRLAAIAFGQAGMIGEVLGQVTTMANVQEARRETGMRSTYSDPHFLRQVTRPNANSDVDFQVYTLQQAIAAMPVRQITREERVQLANRVAELAVQSDGWTAAGATATLVGLGALKYAVDVVDYISPSDPTRSEGVISLVRALLDVGNDEQAKEQVDKALEWLQAYSGRNPERATIWGVAEAYLDYGQPDMALYLLEQRNEEPTTFKDRVRRWMRPGWTDDMLRDNRVRLRALLQQSVGWTEELQTLFDQLCRWAPVLLEGEALISFYLDGMLVPLLRAGCTDQVVTLLPKLADGLGSSAGDKHSLHVRKAAQLLAKMLADFEVESEAVERGVVQIIEGTSDGAATSEESEPAALEESPVEEPPTGDAAPVEQEVPAGPPVHVVEALHQFLLTLWADDAHRGIWQTVHGVEGSLPLLFQLEGPQALVTIAESAANEGGLWLQ